MNSSSPWWMSLERTPLVPALGALAVLLGACGGSTTVPTDTVESTAVEASEGMTAAAEDVAAEVEAATDFPALDAAIAGAHRTDEERARDVWRNPGETLRFFGIRPDSRVIELSPGGGWYTKILAPALAAQGHLTVAIPNPQGDPESYGTRLANEMIAAIAENPAFAGVHAHPWFAPDNMGLGESQSADLVVSFRSAHGWYNRGQGEAVFAAVFDVLKPGGVFGVVQHRAADGADPAETAESGYISEETVIAWATAAGFVLDARSEINANPADTKDHPEGVWSLPPTLRAEGADAERFAAIGESDRMTLRFVRP